MIRFQQLVESEKKVWLFNKRKWRSGSRHFNKLKWRSGSRLLKLKRKSIVHFLWSRTRKCTLFCCSLPTTLPSPIIRFSSPCQITWFLFTNYCQDDGVMFPSHATLYAAPVQLDSYMADMVGYWNNVYGFDMTPMAQKAVEDKLSG